MDTRFALTGGMLAFGLMGAAMLMPLPQSSEVAPIDQNMARPARAVPTKTDPADQNRPGTPSDEVRPALFSKALPSETPPASTETPAAPTTSSPRASAAAQDPFSGYVYTGTVTLDGTTYALLENAGAKQGGYLQKGDTFKGAKVVQIDTNSVTFDLHGSKRRIPKSDVYNVVPLNNQAGQTGAPGAQKPGMQPGGMPGQVAAALEGSESQAAALKYLANGQNGEALTLPGASVNYELLRADSVGNNDNAVILTEPVSISIDFSTSNETINDR